MKIGVGLLAGDVEEYIHKWYENIVDWADWVFVLDSGYHDSKATEEVIRGGPLKYRYRTMMRCDISSQGFACWKNELLMGGIRECDWIFILDADEMLHPDCRGTIHSKLEALPQEKGIATITRWNQSEPPLYKDGTPIGIANWEDQLKHSIWESEPQHKILRTGKDAGFRDSFFKGIGRERAVGEPFYAGAIHEEPGGAEFVRLSLDIFHFNRSVTEQQQHEKMRLYSYLIKRCVDSPEWQVGVNQYWYTTWYHENQEYVDRMAKEFKDEDPRFCRCDNRGSRCW